MYFCRRKGRERHVIDLVGSWQLLGTAEGEGGGVPRCLRCGINLGFVSEED